MGELTGRRTVAGVPDEAAWGKSGELERVFAKRYSRSSASFSEWRTQIQRYAKAYSGDPFDEEVHLELADEGRVMVNFNYALSTVNAIIGQDMADRKEAQFSGVDGDVYDAFVGELYTDLVRHLYQRAKGHRQESQAQFDQLVTGYGWMEVYVDGGSMPFGVKARYVDCARMFIDPDYQQDNFSDGRWLACEMDWTLDDAIARWPEMEEDLEALANRGNSESSPTPKRSTGDRFGFLGPSDVQGFADRDDMRITVYDYQFKVREPWVAFTDPMSGEMKELPKKGWNDLVKTSDPKAVAGMNALEFSREVFYRAWIAGNEANSALVLEKPKRIREDMFTYRCATGFRQKDVEKRRIQHFGLMAVIYEPQLWSAKTLSSIIDFLAKQGKGGGFIRPGALANAADFQTNQGRMGYWHMLSDEADPSRDIIPNPPMQWPQSLDRLLDLATSAVPKTSNITDYDKGTTTGERSNVLVSNLQQHSQMVLNPIMDPMSQMRVEVALLFAKFAARYVPAAVIDKILGDRQCEGVTFKVEVNPQTGEEGKVPVMIEDQAPVGGKPAAPAQPRPIRPSDLVRNIDVTEYHIVVDLGTASATTKQAIWSSIAQSEMLKVFGTIPNFPWHKLVPFLVRNFPGPSSSTMIPLAGELQEELELQKKLQTPQGVVEAISKLPPDQQAAVMQQLAPLMQQQGGGQPPEGAPAPQ